ncbi:MAG: hypothetical protein Q8O40_13185, partial [Chloroflexota bacterium]|nr:hypothetical protein [Chloroflexota bacterium]
MPRLAIWLNESRSKLAGQSPAPLGYYIKLGKGYKQLRDRYGFNDIICGCRGCWPQDTLYDWDYADKVEKETKQQP